MSILIKNGTITTSVDEYKADVLINGEKIEAIGQNLKIYADEEIDAEGMYIIPGGVDNHSHFALPFGGTCAKDYDTTDAAVIGGTTTIVDFVPQPEGMSLMDSAEKHKMSMRKACRWRIMHYMPLLTMRLILCIRISNNFLILASRRSNCLWPTRGRLTIWTTQRCFALYRHLKRQVSP